MQDRIKVLMIAHQSSMISGFNMSNLAILKRLGCDVVVAANFYGAHLPEGIQDGFRTKLHDMGIETVNLDFGRGMGKFGTNIDIIKRLKSLHRKHSFHMVHVHSALAGVLTRYAFRNMPIRMIYTAHGFQFFKGGRWKDWVLYYPIEKYLSKYTNALVTINQEDTLLAKRRLRCDQVVQLPGVGIDWHTLSSIPRDAESKSKAKTKHGFNSGDTVIVCVGELIARKNQLSVIRAVSQVPDISLHCVFCGTGEMLGELRKTSVELGVSERMHFVGYTDIKPYLQLADIAILVSLREGLGLAGLEAMAAGLPLIASNLGGIRDYLDNGASGFSVENPLSVSEIEKAIRHICKLPDEEIQTIASHNVDLAKRFDVASSDSIMESLYQMELRRIRQVAT